MPVDSYSNVQTAYSAWNANPCSVPDAANGVVTAISSVVDQIRGGLIPSIQNVVIVGADDQIPFARVPDGATAVERTLTTGHPRSWGRTTPKPTRFPSGTT